MSEDVTGGTLRTGPGKIAFLLRWAWLLQKRSCNRAEECRFWQDATDYYAIGPQKVHRLKRALRQIEQSVAKGDNFFRTLAEWGS